MRDLIPRKELGTMTNRLFDDFWTEVDRMLSPNRFVSNTNTKFRYPRLNIRDIETEYLVEAGVPGLTKDEVKVDYDKGVLTISGSTQNQSNQEQNGYVLRELHKSSFSRSVHIDEDVCDVENISAGVENGVLTIKIPKKLLDKPENKRIIEVR
jgi:HSP20 family protein